VNCRRVPTYFAVLCRSAVHMPSRLPAPEDLLTAIFAHTNKLAWEDRQVILRFLAGDDPLQPIPTSSNSNSRPQTTDSHGNIGSDSGRLSVAVSVAVAVNNSPGGRNSGGADGGSGATVLGSGLRRRESRWGQGWASLPDAHTQPTDRRDSQGRRSGRCSPVVFQFQLSSSLATSAIRGYRLT
jgi:hypothetical protein